MWCSWVEPRNVPPPATAAGAVARTATDPSARTLPSMGIPPVVRERPRLREARRNGSQAPSQSACARDRGHTWAAVTIRMMAITGARPTTPTGGAARSAGRVLRSSTLAAFGFATGLVVLSTIAVDLVTPGVPPEAAGVIYLVAVLGASTFSGLWWGLATSVGSALAFNFFFLPPAHTLVIRASSDWAALAVFVATAVVTSNLAARARHERDEAGRRAAEARLSESFATMIADAENLDSVLPSLAAETARALGAREGVIDRTARAGGSREGVLPLELNGRWMGELRLIDGPPTVAQSAAAARIARSLAGL